jgi:hypothetical protein
MKLATISQRKINESATLADGIDGVNGACYTFFAKEVGM